MLPRECLLLGMPNNHSVPDSYGHWKSKAGINLKLNVQLRQPTMDWNDTVYLQGLVPIVFRLTELHVKAINGWPRLLYVKHPPNLCKANEEVVLIHTEMLNYLNGYVWLLNTSRSAYHEGLWSELLLVHFQACQLRSPLPLQISCGFQSTSGWIPRHSAWRCLRYWG